MLAPPCGSAPLVLAPDRFSQARVEALRSFATRDEHVPVDSVARLEQTEPAIPSASGGRRGSQSRQAHRRRVLIRRRFDAFPRV